MKVDTHSCDACTTLRKDSNHWYKISVAANKSWATITTWNDTLPIYRARDQYFTFDACGLPHAYQIISKYMEPDSKIISPIVVEEKERCPNGYR